MNNYRREMLSNKGMTLTGFLQIIQRRKEEFLASSNALEIVSGSFYIPETNFRSP